MRECEWRLRERGALPISLRPGTPAGNSVHEANDGWHRIDEFVAERVLCVIVVVFVVGDGGGAAGAQG